MTYGIGVLNLHEPWFGPLISIILLVLLTYLAGRIHQYFRQTVERETAYRDGYNEATRSLFAMATRAAKGLPPAPKDEPPMRGFASVQGENRTKVPARHRAAGRRLRGVEDTKRMHLPSDQAA